MLRLQLGDYQNYNNYYTRDNWTASMVMIMEHCQTYHVLIYNNEISMFLRVFQMLQHLCVIIGHLKYTKSNHKYSWTKVHTKVFKLYLLYFIIVFIQGLYICK